ARPLQAHAAPERCEPCAWRPHCDWQLHNDVAPVDAMEPLAPEAALRLQAVTEDPAVSHLAGAAARRDYSGLGVPNLLCYAPFTSLAIHELRHRPVPCAQSWVDTHVPRDEEARILGLSRAALEQLHAPSTARLGVPYFDVMNEECSLVEIWNAPLLRH